MGGDFDAAPLLVITPAMIGTFQQFIFNFSERQAGAPVDAEVLPGKGFAFGAPEHDIFIEEFCRKEFALRHILRTGDDMPVVDQNIILNHNGLHIVSVTSGRWLRGLMLKEGHFTNDCLRK